MKKEDDSLLNLGRTPTLEELRAHFKENDFSTAAYSELDYEKMPPEEAAFMKRYTDQFNEQWDQIAREMGLATTPENSGDDNPLLAMRESIGDLAVSGVWKLLNEQPERAAEILSDYMDDPDIAKNADIFLHNAVKKTMEVMDYPKLVQVMREIPTHGDFKSGRGGFRGQDFFRKWNHTRASTKTVSLDELTDAENEDGERKPTEIADSSVNVEDKAFATIHAKKFWASLGEDDRELLELKMSGKTQEEIADALGYKTHSAVTKRLQKLKVQFDQMG